MKFARRWIVEGNFYFPEVDPEVYGQTEGKIGRMVDILRKNFFVT